MPEDNPAIKKQTDESTDDMAKIQEVEAMWARRRTAMAKHREQFEPIWETGIRRFFKGILKGDGSSTNKIYDSIYEQYDLTMFSQDGLRFSELKYPMLHTVVIRAMAKEFKNRPTAKFIAKGSNDPSKAMAFTHLFHQVLTEADADQEDFEVHMDRRIRGTGAVLQMTTRNEVTVQDPSINDEGELEYEKKTKKITNTGYTKIDLRNLYLDEHCKKSNLKDCRYAQVDEYFGLEDFKDKFKHLGEKRLNDIVAQTRQSESDNPFVDDSSVHYVRGTHCFDAINDTYDFLVFGKKVNKLNEPIPRIAGRHGKEIPISLAPMYKIPDCPYGYGDAHVTMTFNSIKDLARLMIFEITQKSAKKTFFVSPKSNFDEQEFEWGQDFVRVDPKDVKEMDINPNLDILYTMDDQATSDVIQSTGININDTGNAQAGETARKTVIRRQSENEIIELGLDYLTICFYKRLYSLLKEDIRLHYAAAIRRGEEVKIKTKDVKLTRQKDGSLKEYGVKGFRYFDLEEGDVDLDTELILEVGNIAISEEIMKALKMEGVEQTKFASQGFSQAGLAKFIKEMNEMPDYVLAENEKAIESMSPEELANDGLEDQFLPEEQRIKTNPPQDVAQQLSPVPQMEGQPQGTPSPVEQTATAGNSIAGAPTPQ